MDQRNYDAAPTHHGDQGIMLPFYLLCDVSYSMMDDRKIDSVNEIVPAVADALAENPILSDKVRFSLLDFSGDARVVLQMCDLLEVKSHPKMTCRTTGTSFAAAFTLMRSTIEQDVSLLKRDRYKVHRPAVFFLSDGAPTDDRSQWESALHALTFYDKASGAGFATYPVLVPFGVKGADRDVMRSLVYPKDKSRLYLMAEGANAAESIADMAQILIQSILESGRSALNSNSGIILPNQSQVGTAITVEDDWL